jgi:DNA ligase (NAD+)
VGSRFLYGLGIKHVGINASKLIAKQFRSFLAFFAYLKAEAARKEDLETTDDDEDAPQVMEKLLDIDGIGPKVVESLVKVAKDDKWMSTITELVEMLDILDSDSPTDHETAIATANSEEGGRSSQLAGRVVLFTGKLRTMKRKDAESMCAQRGMCYMYIIMQTNSNDVM